jgi:hypothetical protein
MRSSGLCVIGFIVFFNIIASNADAYDVLGVDIHGFASQGFVQATRENPWPVAGSADGTFHFNDFGINAAKQITPDFHLACSFSRRTGGRTERT